MYTHLEHCGWENIAVVIAYSQIFVLKFNYKLYVTVFSFAVSMFEKSSYSDSGKLSLELPIFSLWVEFFHKIS